MTLERSQGFVGVGSSGGGRRLQGDAAYPRPNLSLNRASPEGEGVNQAGGRAQRWPELGFSPLWTCRGAQSEGRAMALQDAMASRSDSLRLFERRERSEQSEFRSAASRSSTAGCPERSAGTRPVGPPFFCLLFFGGAKKSKCAAGRTPRPPTSSQPQKLATQRPANRSTAACPLPNPPLSRAPPEGEGVTPRTTVSTSPSEEEGAPSPLPSPASGRGS